jgi:hypothetical protein
MVAKLTDEPPPVSPDDARQTLEQILTSRHFVHAPMKRKFLRLVCEFYISGRASELNEYLIGREVFERDDSYNPAADPIVRVGAHDVRKKLELYYETEGSHDEIRLDIPIGSYEPVFVRRSIQTAEVKSLTSAEPLAGDPPASTRTSKSSWLLVSAVIGVSLVALVLMWLSNHSLQRQVDQANLLKDISAYGTVWEPFLKAGDQTLLVISNPPVYRFSNSIDPEILMKQSVGLTDEQKTELAYALKDKFLMKQSRELRLILSPDNYTGMGEAIGLYRITDLFRSTGKDTLVKQSRTATPEDLKNHNLILLGSVWSNEWSGKLPLEEDFIYTSNATIENRRPLAGEETAYKPEYNSRTGELVVDFALVTVKPNISFEDTVMVLAGVHSEGTEAAAEFVTSKNYLNDLNQRLRIAGGDGGAVKYYQALLRVGVENSIPTTISVVALHELRVTRD